MEETSEIYVICKNGLNKFMFDYTKYKSVKESSHLYGDQRNKSKIHKHKSLNSLFDECLNFITINLDCLESLIGFPSDIAKLMWDRAVQFGLISRGEDIHPFLEAYPDLIATSANLSHNLRLINELDTIFLTILCNSPIKSLDLTGCLIGDDHDVLKSLWRIRELEELNLSNNNLSRKGLRITPLYITFIAHNIIIDSENNNEVLKELQAAGFSPRNRPQIISIQTNGWCESLFDKFTNDYKKKDDDINRRYIQNKGNFYRSKSKITCLKSSVNKTMPPNKTMFSKNLKRAGVSNSTLKIDSKRHCGGAPSQGDDEDMSSIMAMYK
nr:leucine-rich repeat-containing protein 42-like [Lepeophtheirus salmonis]